MKILNRKNEQGSVVFKVFLSLILLVLTTIYGTQIGIGFMEKYEINKAVEQVLEEVDIPNSSPIVIKNAVIKKLSINTFEIPRNNIEVDKYENNVLIIVNHTKEIEITNNIKLVLNLGVEKEN
jgi:hypothetical protein